MGYWTYCRHKGCDSGMDKPTAEEIAEGVARCANGHENTPSITLAQFVVDLDERVRVLEQEKAERDAADVARGYGE
jgi:hypothetical protein